MIFYKRAFSIAVFVLVVMLAGANAHAQSNVPAKIDVLRTDDRFTANIKMYDGTAQDRTHGFIDHLDVEIQWWSLIGQPVEIYGLRWMRGDTYRLGRDQVLRRSALQKYPDLLEKYDQLKPSDITLKFDVTLYAVGNDTTRVDANRNISQAQETFFTEHVRAAGERTVGQFLIAESGKMMRDFSPGSPASWTDFLKWKQNNVGNVFGDRNAATAKTFELAEKIRFTNLSIDDISLPDAAARRILSEFNRREGKKSNTKDTADNPWSSDNANQDEGATNLWTREGLNAGTRTSNAGSTSSESGGGMWASSNISKDRGRRKYDRLKKREVCEARSGKQWKEATQECIEWIPPPVKIREIFLVAE